MKFTGVKDPEIQAMIEAIHAEAVAKAIKPKKRWAGKASVYTARPETEGTEFLERLEVELSTRLSVAAGYAQLNYITGEMKIKLHYRLLKDKPEQLKATYLHELAHILANRWYGYACHHDVNWKQVAILLGDNGERCHNMDVAAFRPARRARKRYVYACTGCPKQYQLTEMRHKRMMLYPRACYCRCGKDIKYQEGPVELK